MDGYTAPSRAAVRGICAVGDSNTAMTYMGLDRQCQGCNGSVDNYSSRWTQKLAADTGWRVLNYGDNGRQAEDYLGRGSGVLDWTNDQLPGAWTNCRAKYYLLCFGLNEGAKSLAEFYSNMSDLCDVVLAADGIPLLMTNVSVFYDSDLSVSWYSTNRNITIDAYDDELRDLATARSFGLIDVNAAFKSDIALGNYDHRIRSDGTLDDSADGANTGNPGFANYRTNIHYNDAGATIVSNTIAAYITAQSLTET